MDEKINFACPHCSGRMSVAATLVGKRGKCPKCGGVVTVPPRTAATSPAPANDYPGASLGLSRQPRHMTPFFDQPDRWQIATTMYEKFRLRLIPGRWSKPDAYPVFDGMRALSAEEVFDLCEKIIQVEEANGDVAGLIRQIEREMVRIAETATGDRVQAPM